VWCLSVNIEVVVWLRMDIVSTSYLDMVVVPVIRIFLKKDE